ncbi:MAG TPA: YihY/virulence factor BrkB family protein [Albitalea sp.]|jgi:membrane protein|nr:YihY/virulence factor BrkB family protein [Albitalea sp.]
MDLKTIGGLVKEAVSSWSRDRAPSMGAALSYYTVFSIAPLLLIVISVAGLVFGADAAQGAIVGQLQGLLGESGAQVVQDLLKSVAEPKDSLLATAVGAVLLLLGATTVFAELQDDLDRIWKAPERNKPHGLWGWVRSRFLSFGLILGFGFLLLVSLVASAAVAALGDWWGPAFRGWEVLAQAVNLVLSFALVTVMFALIYRFMPHVRIEWHDVWLGAAVTALLFTIGKFAIGLYLGKSDVVSGFGAAGSLAVLLLWVYYSAQIFLLGAEFTWVFAHAVGSRQAKPQAADATMVPAREETPAVVPRPAAATPERRLGKIATRIQRRPVQAIGVAAVLGMLTAWGLERRRRPSAAQRAAPPPTVPVPGVAKGLAKSALSMAAHGVAASVLRGARQGWARQPMS